MKPLKKNEVGRADRMLLTLVVITTFYGFMLFMSASLGLHARGDVEFSSVLKSQGIGVFLGFILMFIAARIPYTFWRKVALPIFITTTALMIIVLLPGIGFLHGGSRRWIYLGSLSFQPADFFKISIVILYAAWIAKNWKKITDYRYALLSLIALSGIAGFLLFMQPKIGTFLIIAAALVSVLITSGAKFKHVLALILVAAPVFFFLATSMPYVRDRLDTFLNPAEDTRGASYQIDQSLIAVGSGGWFGRGYGQSVQKFSFLPEFIGDSIFAVTAEELGFVGAVVLVGLIVLFTYRGLVIASKAPDLFARLLVVGIVILITAQSFLNIAAMIGLAPLTGVPLVFVSHGGTAMIAALGSVGIVLNVSKYSKL